MTYEILQILIVSLIGILICVTSFERTKPQNFNDLIDLDGPNLFNL